MGIERIETVAALTVAIGLSACGGAAVRSAEPAPGAASHLEARMDAISGRLDELGYSPLDWSRTGELEPGGLLNAELDAARDGRMVLVAIADDPGANLDLVVVGPQGSLEAEDSAPDHRAAVELATVAGAVYRVTVSNSSAASASRFLTRAFFASPSTEPAPLFGLFDSDLASTPSWSDITARAAASGMSEGPLKRTFRAGRGERLDERIDVEAGRCYLFVAQGSAGIDSLAIRLTRSEALLVADLAGRSTAWVRHCAESRGEVKLSVEIVAGAGRVRIAGFSAARDELDPVLVGPPLDPREPLLTVDAAIRWTDQQLARAGYDPAEIQLEVELGEGQRERCRVRLEPAECVVFSAISGPGIHDLDLEVEDPGGDLVAGDSSLGPNALVRYCSAAAGDHTASIVGRGGSGPAVMMVSRLPRIELPTTLSDPPRGAYEAAAVFSRVALDPLGEVAPVTRTEDDAVWSARVTLERERCYGFGAAVNGATIEQLELRGQTGESLAVWKRDGLPATLTVCAPASGSYEVRVTLSRGGDPAEPLVLLFGGSGRSPTKLGTP
jgi:hypothetical protein